MAQAVQRWSNNHNFSLSTDATTWSGANCECSAIGGALDTIESAIVDTAITDEMADDTWIGGMTQQLQRFGSGLRIPLL